MVLLYILSHPPRIERANFFFLDCQVIDRSYFSCKGRWVVLLVDVASRFGQVVIVVAEEEEEEEEPAAAAEGGGGRIPWANIRPRSLRERLLPPLLLLELPRRCRLRE